MAISKTMQKWIVRNFNDVDKIDLQEVDSTLTDAENKEILKQKFLHLYNGRDKEVYDDTKSKTEEHEQRQIKEIMQQEEELIKEWTTAKAEKIELNQKVEVIRHYIEAINLNPEVNFLLVVGEGGIGKTWIALNTLKELNLAWVYRNTHITPLELYKLLYNHKKGFNIILDDVTNLLENDESINILMASTWKAGNKRIVTWSSSSKKLENVPQAFEMESNIIILTNRTSKNIDALKSRGFYYKLELDYKEKMHLIKQIANGDKEKEAIKLLEKYTDITTKNFNFRTYLKALWCVQYGKEAKALFIAGLETDPNIAIMKELMERGISVAEQLKEFTEKTGFSRTSFFKYKRVLAER